MSDSTPSAAPAGGRGKNKVLAGVLGIVLGAFGVHHFYLGSWATGLTLLGLWILGFVTCITFFVAAACGVVEGIMLLVMKDDQFDARFNKRTPGPFEFVFMSVK